MTSPTSLRLFTLYDILGVMIPGVALLTGLLLFLPEPPAPSELWQYLLYGIVAFSLGYVVQAWASRAVGELRTFEKTMDEVRNPVEPSEIESDSDTDESEEEDVPEEGNGETEDEGASERTSENISIREPTDKKGIYYTRFSGPLFGRSGHR